MLQESLRSDQAPYSILDEYPLVLSEESFQRSFCVLSNNSNNSEVIAHANYLPRWVVDRHRRRIGAIGLIGNVATNSHFRGQGIMPRLLDHICSRAQQDGMESLLLWSQQDDFYRKIGFEPTGQEFLFTIDSRKCSTGSASRIFRITESDLDDHLAQQLLDLRPKQETLDRSLAEFRRLIRIPDLYLVLQMDRLTPKSYAIIGKGADLIGVIHEWGTETPKDLDTLCADIMKAMGVDKILLLAPASLPKALSRCIDDISSDCSIRSMAWVKPLTRKSRITKGIHVWGLDSI